MKTTTTALKNLVVITLFVSATSTLFSSCHRGHGCPGHITFEKNVPTEQAQAPENC